MYKALLGSHVESQGRDVLIPPMNYQYSLLNSDAWCIVYNSILYSLATFRRSQDFTIRA